MRRNVPPATEPAITVPDENEPGVASVPSERRAPIPPLADERPPGPPVTGDMASKTASKCCEIAIATLRAHGVEVPAVAHAALLGAFTDFVRSPAR